VTIASRRHYRVVVVIVVSLSRGCMGHAGLGLGGARVVCESVVRMHVQVRVREQTCKAREKDNIPTDKGVSTWHMRRAGLGGARACRVRVGGARVMCELVVRASCASR
jgi:hypothetical protein